MRTSLSSTLLLLFDSFPGRLRKANTYNNNHHVAHMKTRGSARRAEFNCQLAAVSTTAPGSSSFCVDRIRSTHPLINDTPSPPIFRLGPFSSLAAVVGLDAKRGAQPYSTIMLSMDQLWTHKFALLHGPCPRIRALSLSLCVCRSVDRVQVQAVVGIYYATALPD